jgi:PAT family beta-lactamase induction signal transducer AmpG
LTRKTWFSAAALYADRRVLTVLFLGFSSGLPWMLTHSTLTAWLNDAGLSRTAIGLFGAVGLPYALKFLWAPLVDRLRLPLLAALVGRRRSWALATQAATIAALVGLAGTDPSTQPLQTALLALLVSFCSASQDIVIDAYRVELLDADHQAAGAATVVIGYRIGMLVGGAGALALSTAVPWTSVYLVMATLVGLGMATILLSPEPAVVVSEQSLQREERVVHWLAARPHLGPRAAAAAAWLYSAVVAPFAQFMTRPAWWLLLLFLMLFKLGHGIALALDVVFFQDIGFSKLEIAAVTKAFAIAATLGGGVAGGLLVGRYGVTRALLICGLIQMATTLAYAVLAHVGHDLGLLTLVIAADYAVTGMGTAAFAAFLAGLCDPAYTATQYALLSSFMALGRDELFKPLAGLLADLVSWPVFFLVATVAAVPGLVLLLWFMGPGRRGLEISSAAVPEPAR